MNTPNKPNHGNFVDFEGMRFGKLTKLVPYVIGNWIKEHA